MTNYEIRFTKEAVKETQKLTEKQRQKLKDILLNQIALNPFVGKKLTGDLEGCYSMRLNIHDRILYAIDKKARLVTVLKTKTHYGE